jgi:hypothetical protein
LGGNDGELIMMVFAGIADYAERVIMQSHSAKAAVWPAYQ